MPKLEAYLRKREERATENWNEPARSIWERMRGKLDLLCNPTHWLQRTVLICTDRLCYLTLNPIPTGCNDIIDLDLLLTAYASKQRGHNKNRALLLLPTTFLVIFEPLDWFPQHCFLWFCYYCLPHNNNLVILNSIEPVLVLISHNTYFILPYIDFPPYQWFFHSMGF